MAVAWNGSLEVRRNRPLNTTKQLDTDETLFEHLMAKVSMMMMQTRGTLLWLPISPLWNSFEFYVLQIDSDKSWSVLAYCYETRIFIFIVLSELTAS